MRADFIAAMPKLTLTVSKDLHRRLKRHPEVRWSEVVRRVLAEKVRDLELMDRFVTRSALTPADVAALDTVVKGAVLSRYRKGTRR